MLEEFNDWAARQGDPENVVPQVGGAECARAHVQEAAIALRHGAAVRVSALACDGLYWHLSRSFRFATVPPYGGCDAMKLCGPAWPRKVWPTRVLFYCFLLARAFPILQPPLSTR